MGYLPVITFLMVKFGAAAWFREKQKQQKQNGVIKNEPIR
jgi:hypothetical protein